ncbi:MAG: hypothetical protein HFI40_02920 [Lachnospiraceae bacterium]|jgi:hypothetical protein|nr:hypothetical protein [Lachnospiraceae bacterium]
MKKQKVLLCLLAGIFILNGCGRNNNDNIYLKKISSEHIMFFQSVEYLSVEDAIQQSTDIMVATYVQEHVYDTYVEQEFQVKQRIKGATEASTIYLYEIPSDVTIDESDISYISGSYLYKQGKDYMLVLERQVSVYYDHDRYLLLGEIYMPLSDMGSSMIYDTEISEHMDVDITEVETEPALLQYIEEVLDSEKSQAQEFVGIPYEESDKLSDIILASTHILQIEIGTPLPEGDDRELYHCKIKKCWKGTVSSEDLAGEIIIPFWKGQAQTGKEYIVLLNQVGEASRLYVFSSRNSLFAVEDIEVISAIEEALDWEAQDSREE